MNVAPSKVLTGGKPQNMRKRMPLIGLVGELEITLNYQESHRCDEIAHAGTQEFARKEVCLERSPPGMAAVAVVRLSSLELLCRTLLSEYAGGEQPAFSCMSVRPNDEHGPVCSRATSAEPIKTTNHI